APLTRYSAVYNRILTRSQVSYTILKAKPSASDYPLWNKRVLYECITNYYTTQHFTKSTILSNFMKHSIIMKHSPKAENILAQINTTTKLGDIRKIAGTIKKDHELAMELWSTQKFMPRQLAIL